MKKILLFSFLTYFSVLGVFAQSLELYMKNGTKLNNNDTVTMAVTGINQVFSIHMDVKNITSQPIDVLVTKRTTQMINGGEDYFCWKSCYPGPMASVFTTPSTDAVTIDGGKIFELFSGDYEDNGNAGTTIIRYCFFNNSDANDSVSFVARFITGSGVGIDDSKANVEVSNIYPNPANNQVSINYNLNGADNAQLEIRNILGSVVKRVELNSTSGQVSIDVSDLTNGVYFYSFLIDGQAIKTSKLVIQH